MVNTHPDHLLYFEPPKEAKTKIPADDKWTTLIRLVLADAIPGVRSGTEFDPNGKYRGIHITDCGKMSTNTDYLLRSGQITHSLCVYYLRWYRPVIPESEMYKVKNLQGYYCQVPENMTWSKDDLILYLLQTFPKYFIPQKQFTLNRNTSIEDLGEVIGHFENAYVEQQAFLNQHYSRKVLGVMMDRGKGKEARYAMMSYFGHKGYWINQQSLNLAKQKYDLLI